MPNHRDSAYRDRLPQYSESDPLNSHGTEAQDDQSHERVRLLIEEEEEEEEEGEGEGEGHRPSGKPSIQPNHLGALFNAELANSQKTGHAPGSNDDLPRGTLLMSKSSIIRLIVAMTTGC